MAYDMRLLKRTGGGAHVGCPQVHRAVFTGCLRMLAQGPSPLYVVTYVEVKPPAKPEAATLLKSHRDAARRDEGNLRAEVCSTRPGRASSSSSRPGKTRKRTEAHAAAASTREFRDKLQGLRNSPADDRFHNALSVGDLDGPRPARGVYVVTHVDVIPPRKDDAVGLLKSLARRAAATTATCATRSCSRPTGRTISRWSRSGIAAKPSTRTDGPARARVPRQARADERGAVRRTPVRNRQLRENR